MAYRILALRSPTGLVAYSMVHQGRLSRSGLPTASGWQRLRDLGISTVVNLRVEDDDVAWLRRLGIRGYLHLPVPDGLPLSDAQAAALLKSATAPANWPVHVHCLTGVQRSGMAIALIRFAAQGCAMSVAMEEAMSHFPGPTRLQRAWLRQYASRHQPGEALAPESWVR